jgi:hypothetical protein
MSRNDFAFDNQSVEQTYGCITYSYEKGKMKCLSQVDKKGKVYVLLKSASPNTKVEFERIIEAHSPGISNDVVMCKMLIDMPTQYASHTHCQSLALSIDPLSVDETTLSGNVIYSEGKFTVYTE